MTTTRENLKPLPHDTELERRVLAGFLSDPETFQELQADYFFEKLHRQIYRAMRAEIQKGNTPDIFSISILLPEYKDDIFEIEKLGFFDAIRTENNLKTLREFYEKRKTLELLKLTSCKLEDGQTIEDVIPGLLANIQSLKAEPKRKALTTVTAGKWLNVEIDKPISLLPGCLDKGTKANIGGGSKTRKSFFTFQLCISLAAGLDFLNFPLYGIKRKILLINFEINEYHFQDRLRGILHGLNLTPDDIEENLHIVNARGLDADFQAIEATALEVKPDLIVIDPFYKLISGDENKPESFKPILKQFDQLAEKSGAAILTIMHYSKGYSGEKATIDRFAGSGVTARDFDVGFFLTPHVDGDDFAVLEVINRNYAPRAAVTVFFDVHRKIFSIDERRPVVKTRMNGKTDSAADRDNAAYIGLQLQTILEKPLPKTAFIMKLRENSFSADKARAYCAELLNDGTLEQLNIPGQNNAKIIGYPGAIARLKEGIKTDEK